MGTYRNAAQVLCLEIKRLIKASGYNYAQIAKRMNLSESGLKKILSKSDISASRLAQFCEVLNISLSDLVQVTDSQSFVDVTFTKDQEVAFTSDFRVFLFYWFLVYERRPLIEIKKIMNYDDHQVEKFLLKLDKLELLSYFPNGKIKIPSPKPVRWVGGTTFIKNLYKKWGSNLIKEVIDKPNSSQQYFMLRYFQVSEETFQELVALLMKIEKETLNSSTRQMRVNAGKLKHLRWLTCLDQLSWGENEIHSIHDSMVRN